MNTRAQLLNDLRMEIQKGIRNLELGYFRDGSETMSEIKNRLIEMKVEEKNENKRRGTRFHTKRRRW